VRKQLQQLPAIPSQLLSEMVQQVAHNASGMFNQLYDLLDTIDVVALSGFERSINAFFRASDQPGASLVDSLPQSSDLESQVTCFFQKGEGFDDAATRRP